MRSVGRGPQVLSMLATGTVSKRIPCSRVIVAIPAVIFACSRSWYDCHAYGCSAMGWIMNETRSIVFLRAVNVGGTGKVPMADLRLLLGELGYRDVATWIQSGNIVLTPPTRV